VLKLLDGLVPEAYRVGLAEAVRGSTLLPGAFKSILPAAVCSGVLQWAQVVARIGLVAPQCGQRVLISLFLWLLCQAS
jgi:hypothetical protein